jgi:GDP-L-fucose synthase
MREKRKVMICGATGFIGRNLTETLALRKDLEIHAVRFTRRAYECPGVIWHQGDLRDADTVTRVLDGMDVVIQAAATTSGSKDIVTRPHIHVTDNAVMNSLLLRAAHDLKVKHFVFFSCTLMYPSSETPLKEGDWNLAEALNDRYFGIGWTKIYIERMCEFFSRLGATRQTVIRHSNVYGPHDKFDLERSHVFGATVTKVMTAEGGSVTVWGSGEEARDLIHVADLVDFVERAIETQNTPYELFNVGAGRAVPVRNLVSMIIAASGRDLAIRYDLSKPTIKTTLCLDCSKALRELGWAPKIPLEEGIRRTISWWRDAFTPRSD